MKLKADPTKKEKKHINVLLLLMILILAGLLTGIAGEGLYELNVSRRSLKGGNTIGAEEIESSYIQISDTVLMEEKTDDEVQTESESLQGNPVLKRVHIKIDERYINKLRYYYETEDDFIAYTAIHTKNIYKEPEIREIQDISRANLNETIINIKDYVTEIIIELPVDVEISHITVDNSWDWNWYRVAYIGVFVFLILFIICFRSIISKKIERGFLIISLGCGLLLISVQPPECITWDEHIHFAKVFDWFENGTADRTESEAYLYYHPEQLEGAPFLSKEEKALQIQYLNAHNNGVAEVYERDAYTLNAIGEIHMAIVVKVAQFLGLTFYTQFILGKMANLLLYTLLMYWAIKIIPAGKKFLTTVALMPTLMLQSASYTYDIVTIGFLTLGMAMIVAEYFYTERKFSWLRMLAISAVFVIGSCPKQVYIPLLASLLALPEKKFKNKRIMLICKGILILVCIIVLMTILLPAASGSVEGDARGGDTDVTEQLNMVFGHPIAYVRIFFADVVNTLNEYVFNAFGLTSLAYAGSHPFAGAVSLLCLGVALTEKKPALPLPKKSIFSMKVWLAVILLGTLGLIWSALYIAFTPVGSTSIAGVQARYYIPLVVPTFMLFYTNKVQAAYKETTYNTVMFLIILWLAHGTMYDQFFLTYCQ